MLYSTWPKQGRGWSAVKQGAHGANDTRLKINNVDPQASQFRKRAEDCQQRLRGGAICGASQ